MQLEAAGVVAASFVALAVAVTRRGDRVAVTHGRARGLALWPSFRFFERPGPVPIVLYRTDDGPGFGDWHPVLVRPSFRVRDLLINPEATFFLAAGGLAEHLAEDLLELSDADGLAALPSYRLVHALVQTRVRSPSAGDPSVGDASIEPAAVPPSAVPPGVSPVNGDFSPGTRYQFKLTLVDASSASAQDEDLLLSPIYHL